MSRIAFSKREYKLMTPGQLWIISALIGSLFFVQYICVLKYSGLRRVQVSTVELIWKSAKEIEEYESRHGHPPIQPDICYTRHRGYPILYDVIDGQWRLFSYGADGVPGGVGLDFDIVYDSSYASWRDFRNHVAKQAGSPTFQQIFRDEGIRRITIGHNVFFFLSSAWICLFIVACLYDNRRKANLFLQHTGSDHLSPYWNEWRIIVKIYCCLFFPGFFCVLWIADMIH
jgi:hypothetical protein